jgi:hypothetical protein
VSFRGRRKKKRKEKKRKEEKEMRKEEEGRERWVCASSCWGAIASHHAGTSALVFGLE